MQQRTGSWRLVCRVLGRGLLWLHAACIAVWVVGRVATDRWLWSQYLFWVPEEALVAMCIPMLLIGLGGLRLGRATKRRRLALASAVACVILIAHLTLIHWRFPRSLFRPRRWITPDALRVLDWNVTAVERTEQITGPLDQLSPDIAVLVNPHSRPQWSQVFESFGTPRAVIWEANFIVLSRVRILRHGTVVLGVESPPIEPTPRRRWVDPGRAMFVEFDTTERLGRTTVAWIIDMPSDPRISRWDAAKQAAAAIAAWRGPTMLHDAAGNTRAAPGGPGFPAPDIVMGDFNAPRGSASLSLLSDGMTNAFDQGGGGYTASWPGYGLKVIYPVVHIDQMFVGPAYRAARYEIVRPVFGYHWPQYAEIVRK